MATQMLVDLREAIGRFTAALQNEVGAAALVVDSLAAAEIVLDGFFYGDVLREHGLDAKSVDSLIGNYLPIPTDVRRRIISDFEESVANYLRRVVPFRPNRSYSYRIQQNGDIQIIELDLDPAATEQARRPRTPTIFDNFDDDQDTMGAYVPERMRRSA